MTTCLSDMRKSLKKRYCEFMCRHLGHKIVEEVYAEECKNLFGFTSSSIYKKTRYIVFKREYCERCGHDVVYPLTNPMSRVELLKHGWFINDLKIL